MPMTCRFFVDFKAGGEVTKKFRGAY